MNIIDDYDELLEDMMSSQPINNNVQPINDCLMNEPNDTIDFNSDISNNAKSNEGLSKTRSIYLPQNGISGNQQQQQITVSIENAIQSNENTTEDRLDIIGRLDPITKSVEAINERMNDQHTYNITPPEITIQNVPSSSADINEVININDDYVPPVNLNEFKSNNINDETISERLQKAFQSVDKIVMRKGIDAKKAFYRFMTVV